MKKYRLPIILGSAAIVLLLSGLLVATLPHYGPDLVTGIINRSLSFPERSQASYDGQYKLRQYSKMDHNMECLYFYTTKENDKTPLMVSDCEYRLFDFQYLEWGTDTYDVWAVSGDIGTFCYVYTGKDHWEKFVVHYGTKSTDDIWILENSDDASQTVQMEKSKVPADIIKYFQEWDNK